MKLKNCPNPNCLSEEVAVECHPFSDPEYPYRVVCLNCETRSEGRFLTKKEAKEHWNLEDVAVMSSCVFSRKEKE